jgi:hypothetical protein
MRGERLEVVLDELARHHHCTTRTIAFFDRAAAPRAVTLATSLRDTEPAESRASPSDPTRSGRPGQRAALLRGRAQRWRVVAPAYVRCWWPKQTGEAVPEQ